MIAITSPIFKLGIPTNLDTDSNALAVNNVYQVQCDGYVSCMHTVNTNAGYTDLYSDGSNPPTTRVDNDSAGSGGAFYKQGCSWIVRKGEYFKFTDSSAAGILMQWLPFGVGGCVKQ